MPVNAERLIRNAMRVALLPDEQGKASVDLQEAQMLITSAKEQGKDAAAALVRIYFDQTDQFDEPARGALLAFVEESLNNTGPVPPGPPTPPGPTPVDEGTALVDRTFGLALSDDGRISISDAQQVVRAAQQGGVTPAKLARVRELALNYVDKTDSDAQGIIPAFLAANRNTPVPPGPGPGPVPGPIDAEAKLEEAFQSALADRSLDAAEATAIVQLMARERLSASSSSRFRQLLGSATGQIKPEAMSIFIDYIVNHSNDTPVPVPLPINLPEQVDLGFQKALADNTNISAAEARSIIADAEKDGLTGDEAARIRSLWGENITRTDGDAEVVFLDFIRNRMPNPNPIPNPNPNPNPIPVPDPTPGADAQARLAALGNGGTGLVDDPRGGFIRGGGWHPPPADARFTIDGANGDDLMQGGIGDCYLLAVMSSAAYSRPEVLANMVKQNPNGSFTVTFYERGQPVKVELDGDMPNSRYVQARNPKELWPVLIEKAYAKLKGGYGAIGRGGMMGPVISAMTGNQYESISLGRRGSEGTFNRLVSATSERKLMAAGTNWGSPGIAGRHAYTVIRAYEKNGQKFVDMRNPWGQHEPGNDGKNDGVFTIPFSRFTSAFNVVEVEK